MKAYPYASRIEKLTPHEKELVEQLKHEVADVVQKHTFLQHWCHDWTYVRYLTARGWNLHKAAKMLRTTLEWRVSYKPHEITWEDVAKEGETGKQQLVTTHVDKEGRPIYIMRPRNENTKGEEGQVKFLVYMLERGSMLADRHGVGKVVLIVDYVGYSMRNAPPLKTALACLHILQNHYPERLGNALCWHAPTLFSLTYKAVHPFIDPVTANKIQFIDKGKEGLMSNWFELEKLESALGGTMEGSLFDKEKNVAAMKVLDEEWKAEHAAFCEQAAIAVTASS